MDIKKFFKNKLNIAFVVVLAISILLLIIARWVPLIMGAAVMLFGVACGLTIPVVMWFKKEKDISAAMENVELTPKEAKQLSSYERNKKLYYIALIVLFGVFAAVLLYTGMIMYIK